MTEADQTARKVGRPRSAASHQAILRATIELLAEEGIGGMSIEGVAARAGVGKTTIYRRWSSKEELVVDAMQEFRADIPLTDTGNLHDDLVTMVRNAIQTLNRDPLFEKLIFQLIGEAKANPAIFQAFQTRLIAPRVQQFVQLFERAKARGELRQDIDPVLVISLLMGMLLYSMLRTSVGPTSSFPTTLPEQIADAILHGVASHPVDAKS